MSGPGAVPENRPIDSLGLVGAVACCAIWGGNAVAVKASVPDLPALGCAGMRFAIALPVIGLVCRGFGQPLGVPRAHWWLIAVHALLTTAQIGTFNWGTSLSEAGRASVLINVHPLVVAPLAWVVLGERMGLRAWAGLAAAALGVVAMLAERWRGGGDVLGEVVVIASGVIFGIQTIVQKKTFPWIPPTTLLLFQSVLAVPLFLGLSGLFEGFESYQFTTPAVWGLLYQGLAVSGLCFSIWLLLLNRYSAGRLATLAFLTPLFGVALGNGWRGEPLTGPLLLGGLLVGVGIYLVATDRTTRGEPSDLLLPGEDAL